MGKTPEEIVRNYILKSIDIPSLDNGDNLFETGIVNSLFAIKLMTFIEITFDIKITMEDLDMDNFRSVNATCEFIAKKQTILK